MASVKAEKPVGTQLFGQIKKEPAAVKSTSDGASKAPASKAAPKKAAAPKTTAEPKRKAKGVKPAASKH